MPGDGDTDIKLKPSKPQYDEDNSSSKSLITTAAKNATTLLPQSIASVVSFFAQSTSLSLRIGTYFGGAALGSARVTTLTGLELSRAVVEAILTRAGRDVAGHSQGEYGRLEAESILERSVSDFFGYLAVLCANGCIIVGSLTFNRDVNFILCGCGLPPV